MAFWRDKGKEEAQREAKEREKFIKGEINGKDYMSVLIDQRVPQKTRQELFDEALEEKRNKRRR